MINISIIGLGTMGQNHLRVLSEFKDVKLKFLYDINKKKINKLTSKYKLEYTRDLRKIANTSDAVIIATPTETHLSYLKYFLKTNITIFVEKPIVSNFKEIFEIKKILKNKKLQCGFIERFNDVTPILHKFFRKGNVISVDFKRTDKLSNRIIDVNVIHDLMIHDIDLAIFWNGNVKKIYAHGFKRNNQIAYAVAFLKHENGVISKLEASKITQKKIRQVNITTLKEFVSANLISKDIVINKQTNLDISDIKNKPIIVSSSEEKILVKQQESLKKELKQFLKLCKNKNTKVPNIFESLYVLKICKRIEASIEKNL
jgi:predicted dehydrogenase